ncbi:MAG: GMC family oxidoreductase [Nocardioidaceae bacterium]|nr:GMC family oxidoreductase [Nocardioidaceae bacterium]NUS50362.1 GMC family oxidoreductase [Nocardioidaceae bacterium]
MSDVVVVGSGVAGALVAWKLATAGASVTVLEAGPRIDRDTAVEVFRAAPAKVPESPYPNTAHAPRPSVLDIGIPGTGYFIQAGPDTFGSTYERIVGGTTWHWLGSTPRLLPTDFRMRSEFGVGVDWPIGYADLEPWYVRAERAMGVAGDPAQNGGSPRSAGFPMEAVPGSFLDSVVGAAAARIGLRVELTPQARNTETFNDRHHCVGNSNCIPICPIGAKYDALVHLDLAEEAGARVIANAVAFDLVLRADGSVSGVRYRRPDGSEATETGRAVVLAANAVETAKLLLVSNGGNGVANRSDQVGRNLMDHPIQLSWALSAQPVFPQRGPLSTSGIEETREATTRGERSAFRVEIANDGFRFPVGDPTVEFTETPDRASFVRLREGGRPLADRWRDHLSREVRFASLTEQLPDPANRVEPAFDQTDAIGIPRPRISFRVDDYVRDGMADAKVVHERLFEALGAAERNHSDIAFGAGHLMGTTRMGTDPATSVLDAEGRAHDVPNLWMVGSGVFPTCGTANPTLTLAALSLRTADALRRTLRSLPVA